MNVVGTYALIRRELDRAKRVAVQTIVTPWLSAMLFVVVFGGIVGSRVGQIHGIPYIRFVLPGTLMMNVLMASFMQSSSALYFQRFLRNIEEVLVAPISYGEMILSFVSAGIIRGLMVGGGIFAIGLTFGATQIVHPFWLLFYVFIVSFIFALFGLVIGLWANGFEALSLIPTFLITPLTFLGGMFNSLDMLPPAARPFVQINPFFYMIDGARYAMTGVSDGNRLVGILLLVVLAASLFFLVRALFARGWRLRN